DYLAGRIGLADLHATFDEVRSSIWFDRLGIERVVPDEASRARWAWVATYDPTVRIAALNIPVLALFGGRDDESPFAESIACWTTGLRSGGTRNARIEIYPEMNHHMRVTTGRGWLREDRRYLADVRAFLLAQRR